MIYLHHFPDVNSDILCIFCVYILFYILCEDISMPVVKFHFFAYKTCNNTLLYGFMHRYGINRKMSLIEVKTHIRQKTALHNAVLCNYQHQHELYIQDIFHLICQILLTFGSNSLLNNHKQAKIQRNVVLLKHHMINNPRGGGRQRTVGLQRHCRPRK